FKGRPEASSCARQFLGKETPAKSFNKISRQPNIRGGYGMSFSKTTGADVKQKDPCKNDHLQYYPPPRCRDRECEVD
ncbi:unnamed protein product, partial [Dovyalis caffra]